MEKSVLLLEFLALDHAAGFLLLEVVVLLDYLVDVGFVGMHVPPGEVKWFHRFHHQVVFLDQIYFLQTFDCETLLQKLLGLSISTSHKLFPRLVVLADGVCWLGLRTDVEIEINEVQLFWLLVPIPIVDQRTFLLRPCRLSRIWVVNTSYFYLTKGTWNRIVLLALP